MDKQTDLLQQVENEYARSLKYPSFYKMLQDMPGYFPGEIEKVIDDIAQRYAEAYHAEKIEKQRTADMMKERPFYIDDVENLIKTPMSIGKLTEMLNEISELYHAARCQEQGEAFTMDEVHKNIPGVHLYSVIESFTSCLNTRAAEYAAGKVAELQARNELAVDILKELKTEFMQYKDQVAGMYTEEQMRQMFNAGYKFNENTSDLDFDHAINQIKQ